MEKFVTHYDEHSGEYTLHMYHPTYMRIVPEKDGARVMWRIMKTMKDGSWGRTFALYDRKSTAVEKAKGYLKTITSSQTLDAPIPGSSLSRKEALMVLGLKDDATPDEIKAAYRRISAMVHPDRGGSDFLMVQINSAREALKA